MEFPGPLSGTAETARFTPPAAKDGDQVDIQFQSLESTNKDPFGQNKNPVEYYSI